MSQKWTERVAVRTSKPDLELRELTEDDSPAFFDLVQGNRVWLTRYGDYVDLTNLSVSDIAADFSTRPADGPVRMGIWIAGHLAGRVDVSPVAPETYTLGYWIGEEHSGKGHVTSSCRAIMDYVSRTRSVREYWAGVRDVNRESIAVVERLGFSMYEQLPTHIRYRLEVRQ